MKPNETIQVGIIIVNYKTNNETIRFVKEELSKIKVRSIIVIVNNSFDDSDGLKFKNSLDAVILNSGNLVTKETGSVYLINSSENLGFARGNNLGAEFILKNFKTDYLLFTNNDIIIETDNVVEQLIERIDSLPDVALIGPQMITKHNEKISPRFDRMSVSRFIFRHLFYPINKYKLPLRFGINSPGIREIEKRKLDETYCYWVSGSFMLIKVSDFIAVNGFDPNTFLYCEEKILAELLNQIGKKVYYYGKPVIISLNGLTTSRYLSNKKRDSILFRSEIYYYQKYRNASLLALALLHLTFLVYFNIYYRILEKESQDIHHLNYQKEKLQGEL